MPEARKQTPRMVFLVGAGGYGMRALAELCHDRGWQVRGYDRSDGHNTAALKKLGIEIHHEPDPALLEGCDVAVYSSAIKPDHPLMEIIKGGATPMLHRSEFLKEMMQDHFRILVAGTHGKTSTTALIGHMLKAAGHDPSIYVGGVLEQYGRCGIGGKGRIFVAELDESDGTFLNHDPDVCVVTNIDYDHIDFFSSMEKLTEAFRTFLKRCEDREGWMVLGWNNAHVRNIFPSLQGQTITYGDLLGCDARAFEVFERQGHIAFKAVIERDIVDVHLNAIGLHSCLNALAALAVGRTLELDLNTCSKALASFQGVDRRHSVRHHGNDCWVIDDYAHNPGKILNSVQSVRRSWSRGKLICVFEPHRYSRLKHMLGQFAASFKDADRVYVMPVYAAGEPELSDLGQTTLCQEIAKNSQVDCRAFKTLENLATDLRHDFMGEKVVLFVGAGESTAFARKFIEFVQ